MKTQVVQILITRNLTSQPNDVVLAHEVPILRVIRGAGAVQVTGADCTHFDLKPSKVDPRDELIRLKKKYKGSVSDGQNPVDVAYPDGSRDLELYYKDPGKFNMLDLEEGGEDLSEVVPEVVPEEDSEVAETPELPTPPPEIDLNDRPAVMAALEARGVKFVKTTQTKHLATLLVKALGQKAE